MDEGQAVFSVTLYRFDIQSNLSFVTFQGNSQIWSHKTRGHAIPVQIIWNALEGKYRLRSNNTKYCLIVVITKSGLTVHRFINESQYRFLAMKTTTAITISRITTPPTAPPIGPPRESLSASSSVIKKSKYNLYWL
jgi:hypothetical protein